MEAAASINGSNNKGMRQNVTTPEDNLSEVATSADHLVPAPDAVYAQKDCCWG
ncbi:hypothetical protein DFH27DRAFT_616647 [Peziza echinospora]|nr:hypothetical protein DFH27DRAFT_616647 [Peziza echinospora]